MPIYFRSTPVSEPLTFDSIGNQWLQEKTVRPKGYPLYHYLQTESGCGRIVIQGKAYIPMTCWNIRYIKDMWNRS